MYINNNTKLKTTAAAFKIWRPGKIKAFPSIRPANFAYATIEPVKVIAPIKTPKNISTS